MTLALLAKTVEETEHVTHSLPIPPLAFGLIAFGTFVALLLVTFAFKSVGTRHD